MKVNGFTLIELVIVIIILGILSVTALPRFIDLSTDAKKSATKSVMASFASAIEQLHLKWQIQGKPANISQHGTSIAMNAKGYPAIPYRGSTNADCLELWNKMLDTSINIVSYQKNTTAPEWSAYYLWGVCFYFNQSGDVTKEHETPVFHYIPYNGEVAGVNIN